MNQHRFTTTRAALSAFATTLTFTGCIAEFPADNPYDPETSAVEQAPARVSGQVIVEAQIGPGDVRVVISGAGQVATADSGGRFAFEVHPGAYEVTLLAPLHERLSLGTLVVGIGERRELGRIPLIALKGEIAGRVALEGAADHGGTLITLARLERSAFTDPTGAFLFEAVPVGSYDMLLLHDGYAAASIPSAAVEVSKTTTIAVTLSKLMPDADFAIDGGARYTRTATVNLELHGFSLPFIQIAESPSFDPATEWRSFQGGTHRYTLSAGDGLKHVYVRFARDAADPAGYTGAFTSSIVLDTSAPILASLVADDGSGYTHDPAGNVTLSMVAHDLGSGLAGMRIASGAPVEGAEWTTFAPVVSAPVKDPTIDGEKTISVQLRDVAGNVSAPRSATVILDTTDPSLEREAIRINGGAARTRSQIVNLTFGARDAAFVKAGNESGLAGRRFEPYPAGGVTAHALSEGDGPKTVYAVFRDEAGNETSEFFATIELDTTAPTAGSISIGDGSGYTGSATVAFSLRVPEPNLSVLLQGDLTEGLSLPADAPPSTLSLSGGPGLRVITAVLIDAAGNSSLPFSGSIVLDTTPPSEGSVIVAGGARMLNTRDVRIQIADTTPDTMSLWEAVPADGCGSRACDASFVPFVSPATFRLSPGDGEKLVCWKLCDLAGNGAQVGGAHLAVDTLPPVLSRAAVRIAGGNATTRSPIVTLELGAVDATEVAIADEPGAASRSWVPYPASRTTTWILSSGDGDKEVFVRFRDEAGNETAEYSASIALDTTQPAAGTLTLAGGADATNGRAIQIAIAAMEPNPAITLQGDVLEAGSYAPGAMVTSVTLTAGDGPKIVTAILEDAAGNRSIPFSSLITLDTVAPDSGALVLAGGRAIVSSPSISAAIDNTSADTMRLFEGDGSGNCVNPSCGALGYIPFSAAFSLTLSPGDGVKTVCWKLCDDAGNGSAPAGRSITLDTHAPALTAVALRINGGAPVTSSQIVSVQLGATDAAEMKIGEEAGLASSAWTPYPRTSLVTFTTSPGDGTKTIYARFRDTAGNETAEYSASIAVDSTPPPRGTLSLAGGAGSTRTRAVALTIDSPEPGASVTLEGDIAEAGAYPVGTLPAQVTLGAGDGQKVVTAQLTDAAGNTSSPFSAFITLDTIPPPTGSAVLAGGRSVVNGTSISVNIGGTSADTMRVYEAASSDACGNPACGAGFVPFAPSLTFVLSPAQGAKTVCWKLCDVAGNGSAVGAQSISLDTVAPSLSGAAISIDGGATVTRSTVVSLALGAADAVEVQIGNTAGLAGAAYGPMPAGGVAPHVLTGGDGLKTIYVRFRDAAGNETGEYSASITLDTTAPAPGTLLLGGGAALVNARQVALSISTVESSPTVTLAGDIAETGTFAPGTLPTAVTLSAGDGQKLVTATLTDAAGNRSAPFSAFITLDTAAPSSGVAELAGGRSVVNGTSIAVTFAVTFADTMRVYEAASSAACGNPACGAGFVPFAPSLTFVLSPAEGTKTVCWRLCDAAGNGSAVASQSIDLDLTAPILRGPAIQIGDGAAITGSPVVSLFLGAIDASEVKIGSTAGLADAAYGPMPAGGIAPYVLSGGDGLKTVYVRFRDLAGNETGEYSASITLDTTAPSAGSVSLAGGAAHTNTSAVTIDVTTSELAGSVFLQGDLHEAGDYAIGGLPGTVTLDAPDGQKLITAVIADEAGNRSVPFSAFIVLDTVAPADGDVVLAGGSTVVNEQTVAVNISGTAADTMQIWEGGATCGDPACGSGGFVPFSPAATFTLSAGQGAKLVCWKLCDLAGNGSNVGSGAITLSTYLPRPTPILTSISPASYVAFSDPGGDYTLTVDGRGFAADTKLLVGDFVLDCVSSNGAACQADPDGGCSLTGVCASTCASTCIASLPPEVMRYSGTYVVRASTPAPVTAGVELSEDAALFSVVAPLPSLSFIRPRGIVQQVTADGSPIAQDVTITLRASDVMDNVSYRLGPNYGRIVSSTEVDYRTRDVQVIVSTRGILPTDNRDVPFAAVNPGPGGGEDTLPFGVNPRTIECPSGVRCVSNLRWTRTALASGQGVSQAYRVQPNTTIGAMHWSGGTAVALRRSDGTLAARLPAAHAGDMIPFVPGALGQPSDADLAAQHFPAIALEDALGTEPPLALDRGTNTQIFSGRSDGTFFAANTFAAGNAPYAVALGDLDNDGRQEIVVANEQSNDVVIRSNGAVSNVIVPMAREPRSVALADVNGDGALDLLTGGDDSIVLRLGNGNKTFGSAIDVAMLDRPLSIATGDLDHDGAPDLVAASINGWMGIRRGHGDGTFAALDFGLTAGPAGDVALGDLDGDGDLDIAASIWGGSAVSIFFGDGAGDTEGPRLDLSMEQGTVGLALGDVNADGALDLATANSYFGPKGATLRLGNGDGTFQPAVHLALGSPQSILLRDVTGDGLIDLIGVGWNEADDDVVLSIRAGNGDGSFDAAVELSAADSARALAAGDYDGDGAIDLITANFNEDTASVHRGHASFGIGSRDEMMGYGTTMGGSTYHTPVMAADLDRDGYPDLLTARDTDVLVRIADGSGGYAAAVAEFAGSHLNGFALGDLDADGRVDLVAADTNASNMRSQLGSGFGTFDNGGNHAVGTFPQGIALGDFDGDGILDVVTANGAGDNLSVLYGDGAGTFGGRVDLAAGGDPMDVAVLDLEDDGDLDLVSANHDTDDVSIFDNDGTGTFGAARNLPCDVPWSVVSADVDRDGAADIACVGGYVGQESVTLFFGDGDGNFAAPVEIDMGTNELHLAIADINGDGFLDLISANRSSDNDIGLRLGRGARQFGELARYPTVADPNAIFVADINGDGSQDVLTAGEETSDLSRWLLPAPGSWTQELTDMPAMSVAVVPGTNTFRVSQAAQEIDQLAVRVRFEGSGLGNLDVSLISPRGELVPLELGAAFAAQPVWQASYPTRAPAGDLGSMHGWQPEGEWVLVVENGGVTSVELADFAVLTHGAFQTAPPGTTAARAEEIVMRSGTQWKRVAGTTLSHPDGASLSCAATHAAAALGSGEAWYELTLSGANALEELGALASFDAAIELRAGACGAGGAVLACDDDSGVGVGPRISGPVALAPGTYCVVVDGKYSDGGTPADPSDDVVNAGTFELILKLAAPLP